MRRICSKSAVKSLVLVEGPTRPGGSRHGRMSHPAAAIGALCAAAGRAPRAFTIRSLQFHYSHQFHHTHRFHHNRQFHRNRPLPKSAADLQQTLAFWLFRSPGRRSQPPPDRCRLARCNIAPGERRGAACIAAEISSVFSIGGKVNLTARSRHGGRIRSMQSRIAVGSPASASSTAARVRASAPPREALRQRASPCCGNRAGGRPGCPTGPSRTAARAPASAVLLTAHQT